MAVLQGPLWRFIACATLVLGGLSARPALADDRVFDVHVHLHKGEASLDEFEAQLAKTGVKVMQLGVMWFGGPNQAPAGQIEQTRASNDMIIALARKRANLVPIATVHPYDGDAAIAELERVAAKGVGILKIHPHTQRFDAADSRVLKLVRKAGDLGVIVLMDNANILPGDSEKLFNLALEASKTRFIFAHMGALNFRFWNILAAARTADGLFANNIFFDISATVALLAGSPIEDEFVWTIRNVGVDNVLLGSDFPQYSLAANLAALNRLKLTEAEKDKIRFGNAQRLLKLP
jgi:uncharacterized protein